MADLREEKGDFRANNDEYDDDDDEEEDEDDDSDVCGTRHDSTRLDSLFHSLTRVVSVFFSPLNDCARVYYWSIAQFWVRWGEGALGGGRIAVTRWRVRARACLAMRCCETPWLFGPSHLSSFCFCCFPVRSLAW